MVAVEASPVPWAQYIHRGGVAGPLGPTWPHMAAMGAWMVICTRYHRRGGVAGTVGPVWPPWKRGRFSVPRAAAWGCGRTLGPVWLLWGRGWSPRPRVAAVKAWQVSWAPCDHRWAWLVPWAPCGRRGGVDGLLGPVWRPWRRGWSPGIDVTAVGRDRSPGPRVAVVGACTNPWAPCGRRGGVAAILGPVWPPWVRSRSPGSRVAAMGTWLVPWALRGRFGAWPILWAPCGRRRASCLQPEWAPWGRGRSPGPNVVAVGECPVPCSPCGRRGGVAGPLNPTWPPWGRGRSPVHTWLPWKRGRSPWSRVAAVGAWQVLWALRGRRGGMAGPLGPKLPPWGAWPVPRALYGRRGGVAGPLDLKWPLWGVACPRGPVWMLWECGLSSGPRLATVEMWPVPWSP